MKPPGMMSGWLMLLAGASTALSRPADPAAAAPDLAVARVDGRPIAYAELHKSTAAALEQQHREAEIQLKRLQLGAARAESRELELSLNKLIDDRVLALESTSRKSTPEKILESVAAPVPTELEQHAFYESQRPRLEQSFEYVKPQIVEFLLEEAKERAQARYLQSLREKYHAVVLWEPLREHVAASGPQRGPADAKVTIVEFSDFQCPFCGKLAPILKQLQAVNGATVRVIFRNLPLRTLHANAEHAAQAGVCANEQGKFWEMHDAMYAEQPSLGMDALRREAVQLGLDAQAFDACMVSPQTSAEIRADEDVAEQLGLSATPSSFVDGRFVNGTMPLYRWQALIDDELRRAGEAKTAAR